MSYGRGGAGNIQTQVQPIETELQPIGPKSPISGTQAADTERRGSTLSPKDNEGFFLGGRG
jgi:hypothetical protein